MEKFEKSRPEKKGGTEQLKAWLDEAEAVVIGAGAGLSTAAGFTYAGERFRRYFADFEQKYGFHDMYSGGFYPYKTPEEYWAFWSRYVMVNRYDQPAGRPYLALLKLVRDKNCFVLTTNVTASRSPASTSGGCSTLRATTACSSARCPATTRPTTTRRSCERWRPNSGT